MILLARGGIKYYCTNILLAREGIKYYYTNILQRDYLLNLFTFILLKPSALCRKAVVKQKRESIIGAISKMKWDTRHK